MWCQLSAVVECSLPQLPAMDRLDRLLQRPLTATILATVKDLREQEVAEAKVDTHITLDTSVSRKMYQVRR